MMEKERYTDKFKKKERERASVDPKLFKVSPTPSTLSAYIIIVLCTKNVTTSKFKLYEMVSFESLENNVLSVEINE